MRTQAAIPTARKPEQVRRFFQRAGQLDRDSPVPLYYQLQEVLKEDIDAGNWQPGEILPSEAELETQFEVSRTVIRKALDVLSADGQVVRQKGRGTVVAPPKLLYDGVAAAREWLHEDLGQRAVLSQVVDVRQVVAGSNLGALLRVPPSSRLFEITAVAAVNHPVSLTQAYVRCDASPELAAATADPGGLPLEVGGPELLAQLALRCGLRPRRSDLSVEATKANEFECSILGIRSGATTFLVSTVVRDADDVPLAFLRSVVRSDHFRFSATVVHDIGDSPPVGDAPGNRDGALTRGAPPRVNTPRGAAAIGVPTCAATGFSGFAVENVEPVGASFAGCWPRPSEEGSSTLPIRKTSTRLTLPTLVLT